MTKSDRQRAKRLYYAKRIRETGRKLAEIDFPTDSELRAVLREERNK